MPKWTSVTIISMAFSVPIFTQSKIINSKSLRTDVTTPTWTVEDLNQEIRIYVECIILKCELKTVHSELMKSKQLVSDESVLELRLDVDKLQELQYMFTAIHVHAARC